jgi:peptide/nickel transport system substrate-binding protein
VSETLNASAFERLPADDRQRVMNALSQGASRRDVLALLGFGGAAAMFGGGLIGMPGAAFAAETPKKGGRIRVAGFSSSTADTLDPAKQALSTDYVRGSMFYNGLTTLDEHMAPQLELAESIEHDKATVWTIKLRKGVQFHDGKSLTADDVVYSLNRHKDAAVGSKAKALASQMEEIKATGPLEVTIRLSGPNADLPVILGTFHFKIVKDGVTDFSTAVGTGPFKCKEFQPGVRSVSVRNEAYWKSVGPHLDEVEYFAISDNGARVNALLSGDIDIAAAIDSRSNRQIMGASGYDVLETKSGNYTNLIMRLDGAPGNNPDFVLGMKHLFDREQIKKSVFRGFAEVANDNPLSPADRYYAADLPQRPYDLEKAKFLLKKAGALDNTLQIVASPAATASVEMAVVLQQAAQKIGLKIDIKQVPSDGYWSNYWLKSPVGFGNINMRPTADILFSQFFKSDAPWNESVWKNEKFDQLLGAARAEADEAKRKAMYHDMQVMIHETSGIAIPAFISNLDAFKSKVKGMRPMPTGGLMGYNFAEHVWLDA